MQDWEEITKAQMFLNQHLYLCALTIDYTVFYTYAINS